MPFNDPDSTSSTAAIPGLQSPEIPVARIVKRPIVECPPDLPLHEAARRMSEAGVSSILVVEGDAVAGIWTERDALAIDFRDEATFARPIREAMSAPVRSVACDTSLQELAVRFRDEHLRHYVVVDAEGRRCGVVSQTDVVLNQGIEHYLRLRKVGSVITGSAQVLRETARLAEATALMRDAAVDALVVAYADGGFGILTERDVTRLVARRAGDDTIGHLASRPLLAINEHTSLYRVRVLLVERGVRHVGVLRDDGSLAGLVSFADILSGMELAYVHELQHALRERDQALNVSQRNLHLAEKVIESSLEGIVITDSEARIISVNPAFTRLTGYAPADVVGRNPSVLSSGRHDEAFYADMWTRLTADGHWQGEIWNRRKSGELYPELLTITAITDSKGVVTNYAALFSDISALKENEEQIKHLAYYDPLTRLPNRRLLEDRLQVALAHAHRNQSQVAAMFIDLDRFKQINDSLGHEVGDRLLVEVARRLCTCVREDDTVSRMGGDEFVVVLSDIADPDDAAQIAHRVIELLKQPVVIDGRELVVTTSVGISVYPDDGTVAATLIKNADVAMYRAKAAGRDSFQLYQAAMNARSLEHLALESALELALEHGELELFYQPIASPAGEVVAAEALLRWHHGKHGLLCAGDFIALAEECGLILPIGEWVLETACRQLLAWQSAGRPDLRMHINVSARQFREPGFAAMAERVTRAAGTAPSSLSLELKEAALIDQARRAADTLADLDALGFGLALDDFGTGHASLAELKRLPIGEIKIAPVFVAGIDRGVDHVQTASALIGLAHGLGKLATAEGVESASQLAVLRAHGCDRIQGFHTGHPVPAGEFARLAGW